MDEKVEFVDMQLVIDMRQKIHDLADTIDYNEDQFDQLYRKLTRLIMEVSKNTDDGKMTKTAFDALEKRLSVALYKFHLKPL